MLFWYPIEFAQMTLRLAPKILDPVDVVLALRKVLLVVDPVMPKGGNVQHIVRAVAVGVNHAVGDDLLLHDPHQRLSLGVGNDLRVDLAASLQKPENRCFSGGSASPLAFSDAAEVAFVDFDFALERSFFLRSHFDNLTEAMEIKGGGLEVDVYHRRSRTGGRTGNEKINQMQLLFRMNFALFHGCSSITNR